MTLFDHIMRDLPPRPHYTEHTTATGEKVVFVWHEPVTELRIPMRMELPRPPDTQFVMHQRFGGLVQRDPMRIVVTSLPMPRVQGVEAMLADGWRWNGVDSFMRDDGGAINERRVLAGRYAQRLPTNRKQKRARCKARRRTRR